MKLARVTKKGNKSFYIEFMLMTLAPLIVCGIVMIIVCSRSMSKAIKDDVSDNLKNVAHTIQLAYDMRYPGNWNVKSEGDNVKDVTLYKGGETVSGKYDFIDSISEESQLEISIFYMDTRLLTTIRGNDGERLEMTVASDKIVDDVYRGKASVFYDNVRIASTDYYAYYAPIMSEDGSECLGMIGVAKPSDALKDTISSSINRNILVMILGILVTSFFITRFANGIVTIIKRMLDFMKALSANRLDVKLDATVAQREDELGEMGRNLNSLQIALRRLIERDVLTGLYNRRSAEKRIDDIEGSGVKYCVAIGDIDHFKNFNDTFGHECGDVVLREVALLLNEGMNGREGFVARWGGEEFLLVFSNCGIDEAYDALMLIRQALHDKEVEYDGQIHKVTMTFGAAEKTEGIPINHLIRNADDKLYEGKQGGRDRVII